MCRNINYGAKFKLNFLPMQIDDLIIMGPNHGGLSGLPPGVPPPGPEGGGSALKNLALIASRYQGTKNTGRDSDGPIEAKRARVESGESCFLVI